MADFGQALAQQGLKAIAPEAAAVVTVLQKVVDAISAWVTALAPGVMAQFNQEIKNLQATLGTAFIGIFETLSGAIRQVAGIILPVMEALKPVIDQLIETIVSNMMPEVQALAAIFNALIPILEILAAVFEVVSSVLRPFWAIIEVVATIIGATFKLLALVLQPVIILFKLFGELMSGIAEIFHLFAVVINTVIQTVEAFIKSLFAGLNIKSIFDFLHTIIMKVISAFLQMIAFFAKAFGADEFLKNLIENLKKEGQGGAVAAGQFSMSSFEDVNKQVNLAAAQAAGGGDGGHKTDLTDVIKSLEDIQAGQGSKLGEIAGYAHDILEWIKHPIDNTVNGIVNGAKDPNTWARAARGDGLWGVVNPIGAGVSSIYDWATK